ncbi:MAG: hypothetical protein HYU36_09475 [Planctomycetes bacterium]|nr:hypothetical protein [Planctomycetota bacterium]
MTKKLKSGYWITSEARERVDARPAEDEVRPDPRGEFMMGGVNRMFN